MAEAERGLAVRRMSWREGWHVVRSGARLSYLTSKADVKAKAVGWAPTQLDRDAADWVYADPAAAKIANGGAQRKAELRKAQALDKTPAYAPAKKRRSK